MLNIVVINCDGKYVEYEWYSKKAFVQDMQSDNENIPMLDDPLAEVNTQDDNLQLWWRNTDGMTVDDLLEECKQELNSRWMIKIKHSKTENVLDEIDWGNGRKFKCNSYWNDNTSFVLDVGDGEAAEQAEKDGIKIIHDMEFDDENSAAYIDTPENRGLLKDLTI